MGNYRVWMIGLGVLVMLSACGGQSEKDRRTEFVAIAASVGSLSNRISDLEEKSEEQDQKIQELESEISALKKDAP